MYRAFISFVFIGFLSVCSQDVQSPCPEYFQYKSDVTGLHGVINIQPFVPGSSLLVQVEFAIATRLPPTYPGGITPIGSKLQLIQDIKRGAPIRYRVNLPVVTPLPKLNTISVNNVVLCYDTYDPPEVNYVSTISHKFFLKSGNNGHYDIVNSTGTQNVAYVQNSPLLIQNNRGTLHSLFKNNQQDLSQQSDDDNQQMYKQQKTTEEPRTVSTIRYPTTKRTSENPRSSIQTRAPIRESQLEQTIGTPNSVECGTKVLIKDIPLTFDYTYQRGEWPWLVIIYELRSKSLRHICLGTLVSDRHVITAAHCQFRRSSNISNTNIIVKAGIYNLADWSDKFTVTRRVAEANKHEAYNSTSLENDILVLTLDKSIPLNPYIRPACLWSGDTDLDRIVGSIGVVAGWGGNEINPGGKSEPVMVRMPIVSTSMCIASNRDFGRLTSSTTLCAGDRKGSGPCLGDSGGGLYMLHDGRWRLRGVITLALANNEGEVPCNLDEYIVFTDSAQYLPWINQIISNTVHPL